MKLKLRPTHLGILFFSFSTFSLIWFNLHPEELARPFAAKLLGVFCLIFSVVFTYGLHLTELKNGTFSIYSIICRRCGKEFKSRFRFLVELKYLPHKLFHTSEVNPE